MNLPTNALPALTTDPADRRWLTGEGDPAIVIDYLADQGWTYLIDGMSNAHLASPDQLVYVGFLPEAPEAARGSLWQVTVCTDGQTAPAWTQSFQADTPAELILAFVTALISNPGRDAYQA